MQEHYISDISDGYIVQQLMIKHKVMKNVLSTVANGDKKCQPKMDWQPKY